MENTDGFVLHFFLISQKVHPTNRRKEIEKRKPGSSAFFAFIAFRLIVKWF